MGTPQELGVERLPTETLLRSAVDLSRNNLTPENLNVATRAITSELQRRGTHMGLPHGQTYASPGGAPTQPMPMVAEQMPLQDSWVVPSNQTSVRGWPDPPAQQ